MTTKKTEFSDDELLRFSRQIMLPQWDVQGQLNLANRRALIVGLGGLGSPVVLYLAAAGVGELVLADFDLVDLSNLQRQIAHGESSIGQNKAQSAAQRVAAINSAIEVRVVEQRLEKSRLDELVKEVDVVIDCSDNFATRREVNRSCWAAARPLVSGAAIRFEGQLAIFDGRDLHSPCYECLFPDLPEEQLSCSQSGVLSALVGVVGAMQAVEAVKILSERGIAKTGRLQLYDAYDGSWRSLSFHKNPQCPCCGNDQGDPLR